MSDYLKDGFIDEVVGCLGKEESGSGQANVIESIKVNGVDQSVDSNKSVDIPVPTKTSDLDNDSGYMTEDQVNSKVTEGVDVILKDVDDINSNLVELQGDVDFMNKELPLSKTTQGTNPTIQDSTKAPLIYGKFNGYTVQDGTPTPDSPIDIQGLGDSGAIEVKACGKNLFNVLTHISKDANSYVYNLKLKPNTSYTCSSNIPVSNVASIWFGGGSSSENGVFIGNPKTFNTDSNGIINVYIRFDATSAGVNAYNGIINGTYLCQIEEGTEATDYEPYTETTSSIPITSPLYGGDYIEVYADGSGKIHRANGNVVFDGSDDEQWINEVGNAPFCILVKDLKVTDSTSFPPNLITDKYISVASTDSWDSYDYCVSYFWRIRNRLHFRNKYITTLDDWKTWLQSNPVTVVYELATPTEEPLTAEQVQAFKQLYTFDNVTNVICDGETTIRYYVNNDCGDTVGMLQEEVEKIKNDLSASNAGAHNSVYRGKYLGNALTTEQKAQISAGTFNDLYVGDYWTIGGVNYRIAAFDYWLNSGDTQCTNHHVVIVPDTCLYNAQMNTSNITTGAYVGSAMYTSNLEQAKTTINNAFGSANILNHRELLANATNATSDPSYETSGSWYDSTVELMTEEMVYGGVIFHNVEVNGAIPYSYTIDKTQLALFRLDPSKICNRAYWWLRDVVSSESFAFVGSSGSATGDSASNACGVRPVFAIKG